MTCPLDEPDWPLALEVLREANGYDVQSIHVAPDVMTKLEAIPRGEGARSDGMPWTYGVAIMSDRYMEPGSGFAILRNGQVRRLFGKPAAPDGSADR
jgi:hypothetical protein